MIDDLALELLAVSEYTAIRSSMFLGKGNVEMADKAAIEAMWEKLRQVPACGEIVVGEGLNNTILHLYDGEKIGTCGDVKYTFAMRAIEGTAPCVTGGVNSVSVIGIARKDSILAMPPVYMEKIVVGHDCKDVIDITKGIRYNIEAVAERKNIPVEFLTVTVLDRPRNRNIIKEIREVGARIKLIGDGDVSGAIATAIDDSGIDMLMGSGGAREGVISSLALKALGGAIQAVFWLKSDDQKHIIQDFGLDLDKVYTTDDFVKGDTAFAVTGITDGDLVSGVKIFQGKIRTDSVVMDTVSKTFRRVQSTYPFNGRG